MRAFGTVGHIAIRVNDLERSLQFYEKLGFPEFLRLTQADGRTWIVKPGTPSPARTQGGAL